MGLLVLKPGKSQANWDEFSGIDPFLFSTSTPWAVSCIPLASNTNKCLVIHSVCHSPQLQSLCLTDILKCTTVISTSACPSLLSSPPSAIHRHTHFSKCIPQCCQWHYCQSHYPSSNQGVVLECSAASPASQWSAGITSLSFQLFLESVCSFHLDNNCLSPNPLHLWLGLSHPGPQASGMVLYSLSCTLYPI